MKLLLDENLPHQLRLELPEHEVITTAYLNWSGIENGELLRLAAAASFDALLTTDRGLEYEQNLQALPVAVIVILTKTNTLESIRHVIPNLRKVLTNLQPRELVKISLP